MIIYYFDRKSYTVIEADKPLICDEPYERYIPLFQIDDCQLELEYIKSFNQPKLLKAYLQEKGDFIDRNNMRYGFVDFRDKEIEKLAIEWCEKNNINYRRKQL